MAIDVVTNKASGITLLISFEDGFTSLVNNDVEDFRSLEAIASADGAAAREVRFAVEPARQPSNVQMVNPGKANAPLINGFYDAVVEKTAKAKQLEVVAEFDLDVYNRAMKDPSLIYADVMQISLHNQALNTKESLIKQYYGDGTGVQGTINGTPTTATADGCITIAISDVSTNKGCIFWITENQHIMSTATNGTPVLPTIGSGGGSGATSGTTAYLKVIGVNYTAKTIKCEAYTSADALLSISAYGSVVSGSLLFNHSDLANNGAYVDTTSVADYGDLLYMPGLQSLGANDGRVVNTVTTSGSYAGSVLDRGGAALMFPAFGDLANLIDRKVGRGKYVYPTLKCSYDVWEYMINLDAGNQMLKPMENIHGGKDWVYQRKNNSMTLESHRFVPNHTVWAEPSLKDPMAAQGVTRAAPLQFKFTGFDYIKTPGSSDYFRLKMVGGQYSRVVQCHMQTFGTFITTQNAAIGSITGFVIA